MSETSKVINIDNKDKNLGNLVPTNKLVPIRGVIFGRGVIKRPITPIIVIQRTSLVCFFTCIYFPPN
ncbi:MAG: hypothetical protein LBL17_01460 [Coxiellaceae bacterium]|nr:hypothetical protein [Coxiellaceae bacterium]